MTQQSNQPIYNPMNSYPAQIKFPFLKFHQFNYLRKIVQIYFHILLLEEVVVDKVIQITMVDIILEVKELSVLM